MHFMKQLHHICIPWRFLEKNVQVLFFINTKFIKEIIWILCLQKPKGYVCSCKKTVITVVYSRQGLRAALTDTNKQKNWHYGQSHYK